MKFNVTMQEERPSLDAWLFGTRWHWSVTSERWPNHGSDRIGGFARTRAKAMRKARRAARRIEARTDRTTRLAYLEYTYDSQDLNP